MQQRCTENHTFVCSAIKQNCFWINNLWFFFIIIIKNLCTVGNNCGCTDCFDESACFLTVIKVWPIQMKDRVHTPLTPQLLFHTWLLSLPLCWSPFNVWINTKDPPRHVALVCVQVCERAISDSCMSWSLLSVWLCHSAVSSQVYILQRREPALSWPSSVGQQNSTSRNLPPICGKKKKPAKSSRNQTTHLKCSSIYKLCKPEQVFQTTRSPVKPVTLNLQEWNIIFFPFRTPSLQHINSDPFTAWCVFLSFCLKCLLIFKGAVLSIKQLIHSLN